MFVGFYGDFDSIFLNCHFHCDCCKWIANFWFKKVDEKYDVEFGVCVIVVGENKDNKTRKQTQISIVMADKRSMKERKWKSTVKNTMKSTVNFGWSFIFPISICLLKILYQYENVNTRVQLFGTIYDSDWIGHKKLSNFWWTNFYER